MEKTGEKGREELIPPPACSLSLGSLSPLQRVDPALKHPVGHNLVPRRSILSSFLCHASLQGVVCNGAVILRCDLLGRAAVRHLGTHRLTRISGRKIPRKPRAENRLQLEVQSPWLESSGFHLAAHPDWLTHFSPPLPFSLGTISITHHLTWSQSLEESELTRVFFWECTNQNVHLPRVWQ